MSEAAAEIAPLRTALRYYTDDGAHSGERDRGPKFDQSDCEQGLHKKLIPPILAAMLWRLRKSAPVGFIAPCLPSPAPRPPGGHELDPRDQA